MNLIMSSASPLIGLTEPDASSVNVTTEPADSNVTFECEHLGSGDKTIALTLVRGSTPVIPVNPKLLPSVDVGEQP